MQRIMTTLRVTPSSLLQYNEFINKSRTPVTLVMSKTIPNVCLIKRVTLWKRHIVIEYIQISKNKIKKIKEVLSDDERNDNSDKS